MILKQYNISTGTEGFYNITEQVQSTLAESGIRDGLCVVYCPHTTAAITINENADPDVVHDMLLGLRKAFPDRAEFRHAEGNSSAHLRSSALGNSVTVIASQGRLVLGTWQSIYFCEFDGPRTRKFFVRVSG
ncbi:MAG: secondary thiamine-phosphate synthase enzyme YjbQ [Treponema sp.]|jgi:secondary thiamine-phosphate synthase enzyme|nr:secondary thiamine-phosphate synthase enzyme YjbQ [Treponema sp.]